MRDQVSDRAIDQLVTVGVAGAIDQDDRRRAVSLRLPCRVVEKLWDDYQVTQVAVGNLFPRISDVEVFELQVQKLDVLKAFPEKFGPGTAGLVDHGYVGHAHTVEIEEAEHHHQHQGEKQGPEDGLAISRHHLQIC